MNVRSASTQPSLEALSCATWGGAALLYAGSVGTYRRRTWISPAAPFFYFGTVWPHSGRADTLQCSASGELFFILHWYVSLTTARHYPQNFSTSFAQPSFLYNTKIKNFMILCCLAVEPSSFPMPKHMSV